MNRIMLVVLMLVFYLNLSSASDSNKIVEAGSSSYAFFYLSLVAGIFFIASGYIIFSLYRKNKELKNIVRYVHTHDDKKNDYESAKEKELFLAKVSHELRIPLNAIVGLSELVLKSELTPVQHNNIMKIKHSGETILEIVSDISDITKIDTGILKLESIDFDLNEVLEHVSAMISLKAQDKGLELIFNVDKSVPSMMVGDPFRLGQILINLLDNAVKFTKEGQVELNINTIDNHYENRIGLKFSVVDHGIGMSQKQLNSFLKDLSKTDESIVSIYEGLGLGLSITKQLVNIMRGSIDVKSQEGVGTEFIVKIYFIKYEDENKRNYRLPSKSLMNKNAIIVDTNSRSVESLSNMLKYFHYKVDVVSTLKWAKDMMSQVSYDMIFIDENVLLKNSIDILKDIKREYDIKVILIESIYYQSSSEIRSIEEIDSYLLKPFNQNIVYNLILEIYGETNNLKSQSNIGKEDFRNYNDMNIYTVYGNVMNQKILEDLFDGTGLKVTFVKTGKELIDKLENECTADLILMDIPDSNETAKAIRGLPKCVHIPIYVLLTNSEKKEIDDFMECPIEGYFLKPLDMSLFYERLFDIFAQIDENSDSKKKNKRKDPRFFVYREFDVESGLNNCDSDNSKYNSLLDDFIKMYGDANGVLDSIIDDERYHDGENFLHDLKNMSSYIGGHKLSRSASKLEEAFLNKKFNKNSVLVNRMKRDLEMFLADIQKYRKNADQ